MSLRNGVSQARALPWAGAGQLSSFQHSLPNPIAAARPGVDGPRRRGPRLGLEFRVEPTLSPARVTRSPLTLTDTVRRSGAAASLNLGSPAPGPAQEGLRAANFEESRRVQLGVRDVGQQHLPRPPTFTQQTVGVTSAAGVS